MTEIYDKLNLRSDQKVLGVIRSYDPRGEEQILYSEYVIKYNHRDKAQQRVLALTNKAIYNLEAIGAKAKCKRRIPLEIVGSLTSTSETSSGSHEFVVHIPTQYDYRYESTSRDILLDMIAKNYEIVKGKKCRRNWSPNPSLADICITRRMNRDERARVFDRQDKLSQQPPSIPGASGAPAGGAASGGGGGAAGAPDVPESYTGWSREASEVTLESFNLVKVIGRGSFGKVFLAQKKAGPDANKFYALKVCSQRVRSVLVDLASPHPTPLNLLPVLSSASLARVRHIMMTLGVCVLFCRFSARRSSSSATKSSTHLQKSKSWKRSRTRSS